MSDTEQKVEAPVKVKKPMDENRLSQLAAARELAVKARKDKAILKQKEKMLAEDKAEAKAREVDAKLKKTKSLHDAIKKAKMTWKKGHGKC